MNVPKLSELSAAAVKSAVAKAPITDYPMLSEALAMDSRKAVQSLGMKLKRDYEKYQTALAKTQEMLEIERQLRQKGYHAICGLDEVGRGPLAGPVVCAAVIMPPESQLLYVDDSKKLSAKKREILAEQIREEALAWSIGIKSPETIDAINILQATKSAMGDAVEALTIVPDLLLIDALEIPSAIPVESVIHGDARCYSIAAASILAKVYRDELMCGYDDVYPEYGFARNMGYGTAEHIAALKAYGPTSIHRQSFIQNFR
ncbi:MAG: ribonuclease HII [Eubacterium aggregans]|nr:ribonuclease HII [Eubacterium aggregans]